MKLGEIMCSVSHVVSAGNNEPKLKWRRFWLNMLKKFQKVRTEKWQNMLLRETVWYTYSEVFQKEEGKYLLSTWFSTERVYPAWR